jgi:hypothetical protein
MKKVFKDFLNKYYKESLVRKKDKNQKDFGSKVNDCIVQVYNKHSDKQIISKDVILPSGCYSMMLETEDENVFTKCLSVLPNVNDIIVSQIKTCIKDQNFTCVNGVSFTIEKAGDITYTDCCGQTNTNFYNENKYFLDICIKSDSLLPYDKKGRPASIVNIEYGNQKCICNSKQ